MRAFWPAVIVPPVIDHEYVDMPVGPVAVLPVEFAQTCVAAGVIGGTVIVTVASLIGRFAVRTVFSNDGALPSVVSRTA